jgi:Domain of unknown function (DUF4304)
MYAPEDSSTWLSRFLRWLGRRKLRPADGEDPARIKSRPIMDRVLKEIFVPELRARGFTGSFPHYRRIKSDRIDLISFHYPRRAGQFVVELSQCGLAGIKTEWGEAIPPNKVTVNDTGPGDRFRLSYKWGWRGKIFVFDAPSYDPPAAPTEAATEANCVKAAKTALKAFNEQAEPWWEKKAAAKPTAVAAR